MYNALREEIKRNDLTQKQIAEALEIAEFTLTRKLNGSNDFKLSEAFKIRDLFFFFITIEDLFRRN